MAEIMTPYQEDLRKVQIPDLSSLRNCNILVTGSTGLIGSCLVELLMLYSEKYEYRVYAGCRNIDKAKDKFRDLQGLNYVLIDVTKPIACDVNFEYIIDCASNASPNFFNTDPVGVMKANLFGVCNLMDYGIHHGLKTFLYISSGETYGEGCPGKWAERDSGYVDTMTMRACYPSSKRAAETLSVAYAYQYNVRTVVARLCHTYGPCFSENDNRVYAQFIRNVLLDEDILLKSEGKPYRSWLYVIDCAAALIYLLVRGENGEAYNIANEESNVTIRQLAELIASVSGKKVIVDLPNKKDSNQETPIHKAVFDTTKIESIGWSPMFNLNEGILHTIKSKAVKNHNLK